MKILNVAQIRELDAYTIEKEPIPSIDLMERASVAFTEAFVKLFPYPKKVYIFCGLGNNGGDGLAIARLLLDKKYQVAVFVVRYSTQSTEDFNINFERLNQITKINDIVSIADFPVFSADIILIDAIFGSGLSRPLDGLSATIVEKINQSKAPIVAVDIPSGLFADRESIGEYIIRATITLSFQLPKLAFLLPQNARFVGEWQAVLIGLSEEFIQEAKTNFYYIDKVLAQSFTKKRQKFSHKGTYGHALLIMGSYGKMGAAILAAKACLRSGVGLTTVHIPACGYQIMQTAVPEAMLSIDKSEKFIGELPDFSEKSYSTIGIGCGIDTKPKTLRALLGLLQTYKKPLVIDADGLNLLAENKELLKKIPSNSILSPHPKEFERLADKTKNDFERLDTLKNFAQKYKVFVILKGAHTAIATPSGDIYFNSTGNPGMATGGSGDVLAGLLTSLLAQGYSAWESSLLGVYLHGLAGDIAAEKLGFEALIASDLIDNLAYAFQKTKTPQNI